MLYRSKASWLRIQAAPSWILFYFAFIISVSLFLVAVGLCCCSGDFVWLWLSFIISISLVLVAEGLCCCLGDSGCGERERLSVAARGFHIAVASLVVEHRLWVPGLSRCDA